MTREEAMQKFNCSEKPNGSLISRQDAIDIVDQFSREEMFHYMESLELDVRATQICHSAIEAVGTIKEQIEALPSADEERLTDDDIETIKIHLSAIKERLCNQRRWGEAEEYERLIERFMAFASAQPETGEWIEEDEYGDLWVCDQCGFASEHRDNYCPNCGAKMVREEGEEE